MDPEDFPPNSEASKNPPKPEDKKVESVVSGKAERRKKSLRKQFSDSFVAGDARSAANYVVLDVMLPAARDMVVEVVYQGIEKLMFGLGGGRRRGGGVYPPPSGQAGVVNYTSISQRQMGSRFMPGPQRALSRQARASHNFDEIFLEQRTEAEEVIDRLLDLVSRYGQASVADLYELVGLAGTHVDNKWGWQDLSGAGVSRVRGGYLLDLPAPEPLV